MILYGVRDLIGLQVEACQKCFILTVKYFGCI